MYGVNWVTVKKFCDLSGYSEEDIQEKLDSGQWEKGGLWNEAPDGIVFINLREFEGWVENEE